MFLAARGSIIEDEDACKVYNLLNVEYHMNNGQKIDKSLKS